MKAAVVTMMLIGVAVAGPRTVLADGEDGVVSYTLKEGSTYQEGCFEGCACPIVQPMEMTGTFDLLPVEQAPEYQVFDVLEVDWAVPGLDLQISGSGTYIIFTEFVVQHRMELDLQIDGGEVQHFDSAWQVDETPQSDTIDISMSMNELFCYDILLTIVAGPQCMGDLNSDATVDSADLAVLLGSWGSCGTCSADMTGDGGVDAADLAMLLANWGTCAQ